MSHHTAESLLAALRSLLEANGRDLTLFEFRRETGIAYHFVYDRWGSWTALRRAAGLTARKKLEKVFSNDELLRAYHQVALQLDHFPGIVEFNRLSVHCWNSLASRFGKHPDIQRIYREWLRQHPQETVPPFLRGCPDNCEPCSLPGVFLLRAELMREP